MQLIVFVNGLRPHAKTKGPSQRLFPHLSTLPLFRNTVVLSRSEIGHPNYHAPNRLSRSPYRRGGGIDPGHINLKSGIARPGIRYAFGTHNMVAGATNLDHNINHRHDFMTEHIFGQRAELFLVVTAGD